MASDAYARAIVVAPQALKGSLTAHEAAEAIRAGIQRVCLDARIIMLPVSDGGEGLTRTLIEATGGALREAIVTGPLGAPVKAAWGILGPDATRSEGDAQLHPEAPASAASALQPSAPDHTPVAVIEMAAAAGLPLVPPHQRDPLRATTRGVGELLLRALDAGCRDILLGIGGSATNDAGAGMAQALGVRLLDASGRDLPPGGVALAQLDRIDIMGIDPRLAETRLRVACDVSNPLCGQAGASVVYGPQKGATAEMVRRLDAALAHFAEVVRRDLGRDMAQTPGAGAAGGLGAGLLAFTPAQLLPGAPLVLDALRFEEQAHGASLTIVAEGALDEQITFGKAIGEVARRSHALGASVLALAGKVALDDVTLAHYGIDAALPITPGPMPLDASMARAAELLTEATARALNLMRLGASLGWPAPQRQEVAG